MNAIYIGRDVWAPVSYGMTGTAIPWKFKDRTDIFMFIPHGGRLDCGREDLRDMVYLPAKELKVYETGK